MAEAHKCAVCETEENVRVRKVRLCDEHAELLVAKRRCDRALTEEHLKLAQRRREDGLTIRQVAEELGVNYWTLRKRIYNPYGE